MYRSYPSWILGFHGCDIEVYNSVIHAQAPMKRSENLYDWLGHGIYFWENNPLRAYEFAKEQIARKKVNKPAVIGALIDLGSCLDLTNMCFLAELHNHYKYFLSDCRLNNLDIPKNISSKREDGDFLLRNLDCALIEHFHSSREALYSNRKIRGYERFLPYDSVRGAFIEGAELYHGAKIYRKNHIQICVRNVQCIKGFFAPLIDLEAEYEMYATLLNE